MDQSHNDSGETRVLSGSSKGEMLHTERVAGSQAWQQGRQRQWWWWSPTAPEQGDQGRHSDDNLVQLKFGDHQASPQWQGRSMVRLGRPVHKPVSGVAQWRMWRHIAMAAASFRQRPRARVWAGEGRTLPRQTSYGRRRILTLAHLALEKFKNTSEKT